MMWLLLLFISWDGSDIAASNALKKEAEALYQEENYSEAELKYQTLITQFEKAEDEIYLNYGNSLLLQDKFEDADKSFKTAAASSDKRISSRAFQQLGISLEKQEKLEEALSAFKLSLKRDPSNADSRYNYELLKKKMENQQNQDQEKDQNDQDKEDQEKKDEEKQENEDQKDDQSSEDQEKENQDKEEQKDSQESDSEKKDQESESDEQKGEENEKDEQKDQKEEQNPEEAQNDESKQANEPQFDDKKISKEVAQMILQAMENNEMQYLQQLKKKPQKTNTSNKSKW